MISGLESAIIFLSTYSEVLHKVAVPLQGDQVLHCISLDATHIELELAHCHQESPPEQKPENICIIKYPK